MKYYSRWSEYFIKCLSCLRLLCMWKNSDLYFVKLSANSLQPWISNCVKKRCIFLTSLLQNQNVRLFMSLETQELIWHTILYNWERKKKLLWNINVITVISKGKKDTPMKIYIGRILFCNNAITWDSALLLFLSSINLPFTLTHWKK